MAFSLTRGQINPVVNYYYDTGARQRFGVWHVLFGFAAIASVMAFFFGRAITSGVELASAQPTLPSSSQVTPAAATPQKVSSIPDTGNLQTDIDTWIAAHKGVDWGVSVQAFDGSLSASVNADKTYSLASVYKLFLLQPLANQLPSSKWATTNVDSRSYAQCVDAMIRVSDNVCAEGIGKALGWAKAEKYLRTLGYAKTSFTGTTTTGTPSETASLLKNLYNGEGFDELTRSTAMDAMLATKKVEGIRHGCDDCKVYNKIGDLAGYHNDAAIIEKNGKAYSVVIFSKTGSWQQLAELTKVISAHF